MPHPGFKCASWVCFIRRDSRVGPCIGYLPKVRVDSTSQRWPTKATRNDAELKKTCEVSHLAAVTKNAECQSLEGFLIMYVSAAENFQRNFSV